MAPDQAIEYAKQLAVLKFFPAQIAAVAKLAEIFIELCPSEHDAGRLIETMTKRYDEWPGPATLRAVASELFRPSNEAERSWKPPVEWRHERACDVCSDIGLYRNRYGTYQRCGCESGRLVEDSYISDLNERLKPRGGLTKIGETIIKRDAKERVQ